MIAERMLSDTIAAQLNVSDHDRTPVRYHRSLLLATSALFAVVIVLAVRGTTTVFAHPLGNFTINHYERITASEHDIEVYSVLDMAEIPAFRERQNIDSNSDGTLSQAEVEAYAGPKIEQLRQNMTLRVDGHPVTLAPAAHQITFPPGQGGLYLLRLTVTFTAALPNDWRSSPPAIAFEDHNDSDHLGWREIIVQSGGGVRITDASVPSKDRSRELTAYPTDALTSPLDVRSASFSFMPAAGVAPDPQAQPSTVAVRGNPDSPLVRFAGLIAKDHLSTGVIILALLAAMGFGAIHALSPGHGKTIVAAYLIGSKGTGRHAALLGLTVTVTHTSSVYVLGFISLYLSQYIVPERLYPWLTVVSGALIVAMGLALLVGRLRATEIGRVGWWRERFFSRAHRGAPRQDLVVAMVAGDPAARAPLSAMAAFASESSLYERSAMSRPAWRMDAEMPTSHEPTDPAHAHEDIGEHEHEHTGTSHRHGLGPSHSHAVPGADGEPITWRRLVGLGIFGGLLPCPSAIVVMLSAISLHRIGFGLVLIVAFSVGLAGVLTGIGFALVYGRRILDRVPLLRSLANSNNSKSHRVATLAVRAFPLMSAAAVIVAGVVLALPSAFKVV